MAALAMAVVAATACSKDDEQAESTGTVVSTTTVSLADGNKALTNAGVKTFSAGDVVAVVYTNTSSELVKTTVTLAEADISNSGKTASITVSMTDPQSNGALKIVYPASMATDAGAVNYSALANQDGTLATIAGSLDLALYEGNLDGTALPASPRLDNPLAVCAFAIKSATGGTDLTSSITMLFIGDGTNSYYLSGLSGLDSIYVAMKPVESSATLVFHAAAGTTRYEKEISGKTLAAGNMYHVAVGTTQLREGALFGTFAVSGSNTVRFSLGNLQATYDGSNWTWAFATNQYDYIGSAAGNTSVTSTSPYISGNGTVDLFGWVGASSTWEGVAQYGITSSTTVNNVNGYGNGATESLKFDWGTLAISNGGNTANSGWRTLTGGNNGEWQYLFNGRTTTTRYAKATVAGKSGVILFPDVYTHPTDLTAPQSVNTRNAEYTTNTFDAAAWAKMEAAGAVFLPAAGQRNGSTVGGDGTEGYYWSSTTTNAGAACQVLISSVAVNPVPLAARRNGRSVRLVFPVE